MVNKPADRPLICGWSFFPFCPWRSHLEEGHGGPAMHGAVFDGRLVGQIVHGLDGHLHPLNSEKGRQVGCVGRDDDQGEGPPGTTNQF